MLITASIVALHDRLTEVGHLAPPPASEPIADPWLALVARQHQANFTLWHIEDEARNPDATDADLAQIKRRIDRTNQQRNDLAEQLDRFLLDWLDGIDKTSATAPRALPNPGAPLHSESPGLIIDRLSILSLKLFHTRAETLRTDAPAGHAERNRQRLAVLGEQRTDLATCLDALWAETLAGSRRFKLYRQLKMYNDPSLNPVLYGKSSSETPS
jgi:hypothetical protein